MIQIETYPKICADRIEKEKKIKKKLNFINSGVILFILFSLWFVEINIIGRLFLVEVIYFLIALWIFFTDFKQKVLVSPFIKTIIILWFWWLLSQIFTDLYRGTPYVDFIRGWAKLLFFGSNLIALYVIINNSQRRLILFILAYAVGDLLKIYYFPDVHFLGGSIWKFGYAGPVITLLVLLSLRSRKKLFQVLMLIVLGIINFFFDSRSAALNCMLAGATVLITNFYHFSMQKYINERKFIPRLPSLIMIVATMIVLTWKFIGLSMEYDIGIDVGQRNQQGADSNPLYGRLEIISGLKAAMDSPIIGRGSWAKDMDYVYYLYDLKKRLGLTIGARDSDLIPTHSYIVGAWVEAGIMGFAFWFFVFFNTLKAFKNMVLYNHALISIFSLLLIGFIWSIWFSPFGANVRIYAAFDIILVNFILNTRKPAEIKLISNHTIEQFNSNKNYCPSIMI